MPMASTVNSPQYAPESVTSSDAQSATVRSYPCVVAGASVLASGAAGVSVVDRSAFTASMAWSKFAALIGFSTRTSSPRHALLDG